MPPIDPPADWMTHEKGDSPQHVVEISYCNNIREGRFSIREGALNIKYGPNGTGKSTLATALHLSSLGDEISLDVLRPFSLRGIESACKPTLSGVEGESILVFNEEYVSQFVFQDSEILKGSFDIFINTPDYREGKGRIDEQFLELALELSGISTSEVLSDFQQLKDFFAVRADGTLNRNSRGYRAMSAQGDLADIPPGLSGFKPLLTAETNGSWLAWHEKGSQFHATGICPYCASIQFDGATATAVDEAYASSAVKNLGAIQELLERLGTFVSEECRAALRDTVSGDARSTRDARLSGIVDGITYLTQQLMLIQGVGAQLRPADVEQTLQQLRISEARVRSFAGPSTLTLVSTVNDLIDALKAKVGQIKAAVGKHHSQLARIVRVNQDSINQFLLDAGYCYQVAVNPDTYQMQLRHNDGGGVIANAGRHLSYGERNAFALILFMHHALKQSPGIIILDDPVSSFDRTKKYAIFHHLFRSDAGLKGRTTLLLTHDLEPLVDATLGGAASPFGHAPALHFLKNDDGVISEREITKADILPFVQLCLLGVRGDGHPITRCIHLRRLLEATGELGSAYEILSSLLHQRPIATRKTPLGEQVELSPAEAEDGLTTIKQYFPNFDYCAILASLDDPAALRDGFRTATTSYEKIHLFRIYCETTKDDRRKLPASTRKFINESYHIENDYLMQLDPHKFDTVPPHIVRHCAEYMQVDG